MSSNNKKVYPESHRRVFVAMSGGVDSSVAALLLKNDNYDVTGVFMRCYNLDGCAERDAEDARRVAEKLEIPFYVWDFEEEYKRRVVDYMIEGYRGGITPNPDVMCNREIKFGIFFDRARAAGADYIATGHYVRLRQKLEAGSWMLEAARDSAKDQSYFLWTLTQEKLEQCLFPIGDYLKSEVREMARKAGLPTAEKKDSQGICFLGKITLADFLAEYIPERRGAVITSSGEKVGEHHGAEFYTIGQRHIGVNFQFPISNFQNKYSRLPYYVSEKNVEANTLTVTEGADNPALYKKEIELGDMNFIKPLDDLIRANRRIRDNGIRVLARVRYRQPLSRATLYISNSRELENRENNSDGFVNSCENITRLVFDQPQKFVASGQSAVFYMEDPSTHSTNAQGGTSREPQSKSERSRITSSGLKMLGGGVIA